MSTLAPKSVEEIKSVPEAVQREVFDFLAFHKSKEAARNEGREELLPLAQTAWATDWSAPEEDEAWRDL